MNVSKSSNTIGFDNNGRKDLNTLRQIGRYMNEVDKVLNGINKISS